LVRTEKEKEESEDSLDSILAMVFFINHGCTTNKN